MSKLIELDAASEIVRFECGKWEGLANTIIKEFYAIKPVDAVPVRRGQWRHYEGVLTCSECGTEYYDDIIEWCGDHVPKFCPECGADMRKDGDDD